MGTSKDYGVIPNWQGVKSAVTAAAGSLVTPKKAADLAAAFLQKLVELGDDGALGTPLPPDGSKKPDDESTAPTADGSEKQFLLGFPQGIGGAKGASSLGRTSGSGATGRGTSGGGRRETGGRSQRDRASVRGVAQNIGHFFSEVSKLGFRAALEKAGLKNIDKLSPQEVALSLSDLLGGDANLFEETAIRDALTALVQDMAESAESFEVLGETFAEQAPNIEFILERFFGNYIFELFCSTTYKGILEKHGPESAERLAGQVRDFIDVKLSSVRKGRKMADIDWSSDEGARIVDATLAKTVEIFGGTSK